MVREAWELKVRRWWILLDCMVTDGGARSRKCSIAVALGQDKSIVIIIVVTRYIDDLF